MCGFAELTRSLAYKVYHFDRHVWDVPPADWVKERQIAWALEVLYVISSCMIKISVLLFYRRMGFRSVSRTFRVITTISIVSVILFTISFILTLSLGCQPFSAYWDRVNVGKLVQGYKYHCFDEPAFLISASFINTVQDFIATTMPAVLCWQLQVRKRQRLALYACFGVGYIVTIVSAVRIWCIWETFLLSYDASWNSYWTWICIMLETMLASIFSSIPSLRFLFQHFKESSMRISSDAGDTRHSALPGIRFWRWRQREKREHLTSEGSEIPPEVCDNMLRDGAGV